MEHDHEMHAHHGGHDDHYTTIYPPDLHSYDTSSSTFMISDGTARQRFLPSDAFGTPHRHDQHEAEHVYNSPQLTLDPSTLDLRSNSNENLSPSANTSGSNNTTPTGSLRLSGYNLPSLSPSGVTTRRRARAALEQLQIQIQVGVHSETQMQSPHHLQHQDQPQHHPSDMQELHMHSGEMQQMHVDDCHESGMVGVGIGHEQGQSGGTSHTHNMYAILSDPASQSNYFLHSDAFTNSPISASTPPDATHDSDLQVTNPTSTLTASNSTSVSMGRAFRPGSLTLGVTGSRSMPLVPPTPTRGSPGQQQMSPSHVQHPQLSSHPHMHPSPYYSLSNNAGSPSFPSTPTTSHHTQGSSSSSHSSGHTRYSLRGSPGSRGFGRGHARSNSYGTVSTMSVRSSSPASSVASAFTSLSGGAGGSAPASTSGPLGSPTSYGEGGDVQMPFANAPSTEDGSHQVRSQSHPPLSMPTAHPALAAYSSLLSPQRKPMMQQGTGDYISTSGGNFIEGSRDPVLWPSPPDDYRSPPPGPRMTEEEYQAQFRPSKATITRAPHRKQKLANSDRKAICLYAKQHQNARQEDIAARYNVERSTISKILKNKERWLGCPDDDVKVARKRKPRFDDLELVLKMWVEEMKPQGIILSDALIRSKAKEEARRLGILEDKFKASSGWLENFKHRVGIRKGKYIGREPWPEASDSEGEESPLTVKQNHEQRMVWQTEPSPGPEHATKGLWRVPVQENHPRQITQAEEQAALPSSDHTGLGQSQTSGHNQVNEPGSEQAPMMQQHLQSSGPRPASRLEDGRCGAGMRKTRSRTLAEARESEAALTGESGSSSIVASSATSLAAVPTLAPAAAINPSPRQGLTQESLAKLSCTSPSTSTPPSVITLPDGRDASAGLDAALDFIGCQPQGFATPEEVAVLKKLSRRMSRAELSRLHPSPSMSASWSGIGET